MKWGYVLKGVCMYVGNVCMWICYVCICEGVGGVGGMYVCGVFSFFVGCGGVGGWYVLKGVGT